MLWLSPGRTLFPLPLSLVSPRRTLFRRGGFIAGARSARPAALAQLPPGNPSPVVGPPSLHPLLRLATRFRETVENSPVS